MHRLPHVCAEEFADALFARVPVAWVTRALVLANMLLFGVMALQAEALWRLPGALLADWGGNYAVHTRGGQPWRLLSALFVHGGLLHVALNMLALFQAGELAERLFGHRRFALLYFACGVMASIASVWWRPQGLSVGASGAVFGVFGGLLSYVLVRRASLPAGLFSALRGRLVLFIAYSLAAGFLLPGIDNAAHLGGLASGLLLGAALALPSARHRPPVVAALVTAGVAAVGGGLWVGAAAPPTAQVAPERAWTALSTRIARTEAQLVQRHHLMVDALRDGALSAERAQAVIDGELVPAWRALEDAVAAHGAGDWRAAALSRYLAKRRDALQALSMALATHDEKWLEFSNALQHQADDFLLEYRMLEAGRPVDGDVQVQENN